MFRYAFEYLSESVFKNFVRFEEDKVVLKDSCPKELAIIFYYMEKENNYLKFIERVIDVFLT